MSRETALIVEDDAEIRELLNESLEEAGLDCEFAAAGDEGLEKARRGSYALIILDLMLPRLGGIEVCRRIRAENLDVPILILTARDTEVDTVLGLELGADDYLSKPFAVSELLARVKALLRRSRRAQELVEASLNADAAGEHVEQFADIVIDRARRRLSRNGAPIELSAMEFDLLCVLARRPGVVLSRQQLLEEVWNMSNPKYEVNVNTAINRLRQKMEPDPRRPKYIKTARGVGYFFEAPDTKK